MLCDKASDEPETEKVVAAAFASGSAGDSVPGDVGRDQFLGCFENWFEDPVDGKPLEVRAEGKGYRVVSAAAAAVKKDRGARRNAPDLGFSIVK
jgi:hypothetical protein